MTTRGVAGLVTALMMVLIVGCGSSKPETTVRFDGKTYTCETVVALAAGDDCSASAQEAFDLHKDNIGRYVTSGRLGELNDAPFTFEDRAYAGLVACVNQKYGRSKQVYVAFMQEMATYANLPANALALAWSEARVSLCP